MIKLSLLFIMLLSVSLNVFSIEPEYNANSKILSIPSVKIGTSFVYNVELQLNNAGNFVILGFSNTPPSNNIDEFCTADKITLEKFNQISGGMTLEQVNNIIGCEGELRNASSSSSSYKWTEGSFPQIVINFQDGLSSSIGSVFLP